MGNDLALAFDGTFCQDCIASDIWFSGPELASSLKASLPGPVPFRPDSRANGSGPNFLAPPSILFRFQSAQPLAKRWDQPNRARPSLAQSLDRAARALNMLRQRHSGHHLGGHKFPLLLIPIDL
jgi:hypothetical protein